MVLLYEAKDQKAVWWRLDFWMSQLLAWCFNLFKEEGAPAVKPASLLPEAKTEEPRRQSPEEMKAIMMAIASTTPYDD